MKRTRSIAGDVDAETTLLVLDAILQDRAIAQPSQSRQLGVDLDDPARTAQPRPFAVHCTARIIERYQCHNVAWGRWLLDENPLPAPDDALDLRPIGRAGHPRLKCHSPFHQALDNPGIAGAADCHHSDRFALIKLCIETDALRDRVSRARCGEQSAHQKQESARYLPSHFRCLAHVAESLAGVSSRTRLR